MVNIYYGVAWLCLFFLYIYAVISLCLCCEFSYDSTQVAFESYSMAFT